MPDDFYNEQLGVPYVDPNRERYAELAELYERECEEFDRTVCTGDIVNGSIRPSNGNELRLINRNAMKVMSHIRYLLAAEGLTMERFQAVLSEQRKLRKM